MSRFTLNTRAGRDNVLVYPYDEAFFFTYGNFLDLLDKLANQYDLDDRLRSQLYGLCPPSMLVEIMLHEEIGDPSISDGFADLVVQVFPDEVAGDLMDLITGFVNDAPKPNGFEELVWLVFYNDTLTLVSLESVREHDAMVYTFTSLVDSE